MGADANESKPAGVPGLRADFRELSAHASSYTLAAALLAALVICYLAGLGLRPLVAADEFRYAEIAREMLTSGDWVLPRLDGALYFQKPVFGYWLTALSLHAFGHNAFAARLPFALATLAAAASVFGLVRRFGPGGRWAVAAAAGFLSSAGVIAIGTAAVLDGLFALWVSASLAAFFAASEQPAGRARQIWLALAGVACGAAFLTKGFLAVAIPVCVVIPYLVWSKRSTDMLRLAWTPLIAALLTVAPWSLAIEFADGDFWRHFFVDEHWRRFTGGIHAQHPEPFWYFLPVVLVGALPWTPLIPVMCRAPIRTPLARFAICWLVAPLLLLSASSGKLATYALPCVAPLFVWMACAAAALPTERLAQALRRVAYGVAALAAVCGLGLLSPLATGLGLDAVIGGGQPGPRFHLAAGLLLAAALATLGARSSRVEAPALGIGVSLPLIYAIVTLGFPAVPLHKAPGHWLAREVGPVPAQAIVVADRILVHAVCWQLRRSDVSLLGSPGELTYGFARADQRGRVLDEAGLAALLHDPARTRPVAVFVRTDRIGLPTDPAPLRRSERGTVAFALYGAPATQVEVTERVGS